MKDRGRPLPPVSHRSRARPAGPAGASSDRSGTSHGRRVDVLALSSALVLAGVLTAITLLTPVPRVAAGAAVVVTSLGAVLVAVGWQGVTGMRPSVGERIAIGIAGVGASVAAFFGGDLSGVVSVCAAGVLVLVVLTLAAVPASGASTMPSERLMALPNSVCGLLVAVAGSCWVALEEMGQGRAMGVGLLAVVVASCAAALSGSVRVRAIAGLVGGTLVGGLGGVLGWVVVPGGEQPAVLAGVVRWIGAFGAAGLIGVALGVSVSLAVLVLDAVIRMDGTEARRAPHAGSLSRRRAGTRRIPGVAHCARGCSVFLVAAVPVWATTLVGAA